MHNEAQHPLAQQSKGYLGASGRFKKPIVTEIRDAKTFYVAEDYHQDYYKKELAHYKGDRAKSGHDAFINEHW